MQGLGARCAVFHITEMMWEFGIVLHDSHFLLTYYVAAEILIELDAGLQSHAEGAGLIVGVEKLFAGVDLENVFPAAAAEWFEKSGEADVIEHLIPVQREHEVAHGLHGGSGRMCFVREDDCFRNSDSEFAGECVVEELVVGTPPEGIVDDNGSAEDSVF